MRNILTIDNGNTSPSVGTFAPSGNLDHIHPLSTFLDSNDIDNHTIVLADVGRPIPQLENHHKILRVAGLREGNSFLGMPVHYSPSLGEDRLVSGWKIYREKMGATVLIDAGTFITIDLIDHRGFQGGYILPGIQTFLNSYSAGADLPLPENFHPNAMADHTPPRDTMEALLASCRLYLHSVIKQTLSRHSPFTRVCLTGGDASRLTPFLPERTPLQCEPHLTHKALYEITQFKQKKSLPPLER